MLNNAVIVFVSDNGAPGDSYASNWPLRGAKNSAFEGGVRGVGLMWSSWLRNRGVVSRQIMHAVDWLPTLMHAAQLDRPQHLRAIPPTASLTTAAATSPASAGGIAALPVAENIDGIDLWEALVATTTTSVGNVESAEQQRQRSRAQDRHEVLIALEDTAKGGLSAIRVDAWKLVSGKSSSMPPNVTNPDNWYYPDFDSRPVSQQRVATPSSIGCPWPPPAGAESSCTPEASPCLFNVVEDPCEYYNVAGENQQVVQALQKRLEHYKLRRKPSPADVADPLASPTLYNNTWVPWLDARYETVMETMPEELIYQQIGVVQCP